MTMTTTTTDNGSALRKVVVVASDELRLRRTRLGLSRAELAAAAECSLSTVSNIEQGAVPRRGYALERMRAALNRLEKAA